MALTSFSQNNMFNKCPRMWYYSYIKKIPVVGETAYLDAGKLLHDTLELHYGKKATLEDCKIFFEKGWKAKKLDEGILRMKADEYWLMAINGIALKKELTSVELKIFFEDVIAYLDGVNTKDDTLLDWKSSTRRPENEEEYKMQLLYYSWLYKRKFGRDISEATVHYLKYSGDKGVLKIEPTENDISYISSWHNIIKSKMDEIRVTRKIPDRCAKCFDFCAYKDLCFEGEGVIKFVIEILGHYIKIKGNISPVLHKGIDRKFSYELKSAYFIKKNCPQAKTTIKFWNARKQLLPIGFMEGVIKTLKDYAEHKGLKFALDIEDKRRFNPDKIAMPDKLLTKELREYQETAATDMIRKQIGLMELATGSGKTVCAAEIIRRHGWKTLFIVDKIELLRQTKEVFEKELGVEVGTIGAGEDNIKHITVATVQTLVHNLQKYANYLASVRVCFFDETHHVSSRSYQKISHYLNNTEFRCGLSGTCFRDDGNDMQIYAVTGYKAVDLSSKKLIEMGFLTKPHIHFVENFMDDKYQDELIRVSKTMLINETPNYNEYYKNFIAFNEKRNDVIKKIVDKNPDKRILILTKLIDHGKFLAAYLGGVHLYGSTKKEDRLAIMSDFKNGKIKVLVSTVSIFSEGIDIPQLDIVINASGNKGDVKSLQMLGRVMRLFEGKDKAEYYDFYDTYKWFKQASRARETAFLANGHDVDYINTYDI